MRILIVGNGMAGARLASDLSSLDTRADVMVLGAEQHPAYNRILLSSVLAGKHRPHDIGLVGGAKARLGVTVTAIDRAAQAVTTESGERIGYDHLILATGSRALVPPLPGLDKAITFRTLDDCHRILGQIDGASTALVLGGGLLGLEAARGLAGRGLKVDVVHAVGHLMERQLDSNASRVLERTLTELGITVHLNASAVRAGADWLELADGRVMRADLLVVACGVRPEIGLATEAGLKVERGIVIDERLRTSDRRISAIGDCAQVGSEVSGLVAPAWEQARVVARQLTGAEPLAVYTPPAPVTRLKASGIDLAAMGSLQAEGAEDLSFQDISSGTYARLLIKNERVAGAVMLGDNPSVGKVIQLFDRKLPVPLDRRALLLGRSLDGSSSVEVDSPALMPDAATVCQCNSVTKGALVNCWRDGRRVLAEVVERTRVTTGCGSCRDTVEGIMNWLARGEAA
ncbi:MAG TPA: FAD-dependent oxidoreductase [Candidatus Limnocylindrales bacterium]